MRRAVSSRQTGIGARASAGLQPSRLGRSLLILILVVAALVRAWGVGPLLPRVYHADEPTVVRAASYLHWSDLDPHFFRYPTGLLYGLRALWAALGLEADDLSSRFLSGRLLVVLLGVLTVYGVWLLGRLDSERVGLASAALLAAMPLHVTESRFLTVDVPCACLLLFALYYAGLVARDARWQDVILAGVLVGVAASVKYTAALAMIAVLVASLRRPWGRCVGTVAVASACAGVVFLALSPFVVLDFPAFWRDFTFERAHMATGHYGLRLGSWTGLWYLRNGLRPTLLLPGMLLAALGLFRVYFLRQRPLVPAVTFGAIYFALISSWKTYFIRYLDPLLPLLALLMALAIFWIAHPKGPWPRTRLVVAFAVLAGLFLAFATRGFERPRPRALHARWQAERWLLANAGDSYVLGDGFTPARDLITPGVWVPLQEAGARDTPALYDPKSGALLVQDPGSATQTRVAVPMPRAGMVPIAADLNGSGRDMIGFYDPTAGLFEFGAGADHALCQFGPLGQALVPLCGDWDGDGKDGIGLYDPVAGMFYLRDRFAGSGAELSFRFGPLDAGMVPMAGDWNGDGLDTIGLYNPKTATFFLSNHLGPGPADVVFSSLVERAGSTPIAGDWDGSGADDVGIYDPAAHRFYLANSLDRWMDVELSFPTANGNWVPLAGHWAADRPAVARSQGIPRRWYVIERFDRDAIASSGARFVVISRDVWNWSYNEMSEDRLQFYDELERRGRLAAAFPKNDEEWQMRIYELPARESRPPEAPIARMTPGPGDRSTPR